VKSHRGEESVDADFHQCRVQDERDLRAENFQTRRRQIAGAKPVRTNAPSNNPMIAEASIFSFALVECGIGIHERQYRVLYFKYLFVFQARNINLPVHVT
jgi:hypothetical protein